MPSSPLEIHVQNTKRVLFIDHDEPIFNNCTAHSYVPSTYAGTKQPKFLSEPIPAGSAFDETVACGLFPNRPVLPPKNPRTERLKDKRFDYFKTWSGKFEKQLSHLRGRPRETGPDANSPRKVEVETLPVDRYFDALEGPELDTLRVRVSYLRLVSRTLFVSFIYSFFFCTLDASCNFHVLYGLVI